MCQGGRPGPGRRPARFRAPNARCVCFASTRPSWQAGDEAWSLESKGCGLRSDCAPAKTPVPSWRTLCLDGVGSIPAGHVLGVNKVFHQRVPRLSSHCACLLATSRPPHHTSALTAGGEEASARDCLDARLDASCRVSDGLEAMPPLAALDADPRRPRWISPPPPPGRGRGRLAAPPRR